MTTSNALYKKAVSIASGLSVESLKEEIRKYMNITDEYAGVVFNCLLTALEGKVSEVEFIAFCESL